MDISLCMSGFGVEWVGLVPWVVSPPVQMLLLGFTYEKHFKARPTQKRYYTTRVVRHWYVTGTDNSNYTRYHIEL